MMYLNTLDFIVQNLSTRWRLQLNGGQVLEGHFDRRQFQRLRALKEKGEFDPITHFKFAIFKTSRQPCIVNTKEIITMIPFKTKGGEKHG